MKRAKKKDIREEMIKNILDGLAVKELGDFVISEIRKDESMCGRFLSRFGGVAGLSIRNFRREINDAYLDVAPGFNLEPDEFIEDAKEIENAGKPAEAIKAFRGIADGIADNGDRLDESEAFDVVYFKEAIQGMARCINQQNMTHQKKRKYILYLFEKIRDECYYYWEGACIPALEEICTYIKDLRYWLELLESATLDYKNRKEFYEDSDVVHMIARMQTFVRKKIGKEPLEDIYQTYYLMNRDVCVEYVSFLAESNPDKAKQVAREGCDLFSRMDSNSVIFKALKS